MSRSAQAVWVAVLTAGGVLGGSARVALAQPGEPPAAELPDAQAPAEGDPAEGAEAGDPGEVAPPPAPASIDKWNDAHSIPRSQRALIAWPKMLGIWIVFLLWVRSCDWVNRDSQAWGLGYGTWNPVVCFPVMAILLLYVFPLILPIPGNYIVAMSLLSVVYLATFIPYVVVRNKSVEAHQKVFTAEWFRYELAQLLSQVGVKMDVERKADYEKGPPVELSAFGAADEHADQANLITARHSPGFLLVKQLLADMVDRRSERAVLEYSQQSVVEKHRIDGVWHNGEARDRESGDVLLAVMKTLANLDMNERRKKQTGRFVAKYLDAKYMCPIVSQGVKTGERVILELLGGRRDSYTTYAELGMREKLAEQWAELMSRDQGLLIISAMPEGGVTTLTDVALMETDRLMRDFVSLEDEQHREREIENIDIFTYNSKAGETPDTVLPQLVRKYPNVYVVRDFVNPEAAKILFQEIRDDHLVITNVHAKDCAEALLRILEKKVSRRDFAALATAVLNTRLVRKLCEECRVAYEPSPDLLKKLGIPAGKVEVLYRTPKGEEIDKPCKQCNGLGYLGRTGLFEMLEVNDKIREILVKQPRLELLRKAGRAARVRTHQEEGLLLVARGVTSLQELQRVLKQ